ncbi:transcriptional regulator [Clostridium carboxidivorans P7]|uniref:Stage 0 sporulation protein A homolog n=1 Tax=Clostridium carboxidivorans P7 TaxID=536227 RepID=C6PXD6_9CLOT|nr:response regulator transcription factor [Clostridium carboxidivorans]AKN31543.1 transcriptional regulator [Clostridium carboxidivorans P7]EET86125.1 two component transcriptional regulator, winged helix family [Clostridium carboxidivorans P7]EFG87047.1 response regulator receiver domain protein [Clostridium carboxidivorans P7]
MNDIKKILVVDDEPNIVEVVEAYLRKEGFQVVTAENGEKALRLFKEEVIHLVILDLMLPRISGEEICNKIRAVSDVPIIMLTAKSEEEDKISGLAIGADDYLTKPFSVRELVGRVKALIRRTYRDSSPLADYLLFNNGDLEVQIKKMKVKKAGEYVNLTANEFKVLLALLTNPGQVFSREQLVQKAFGEDYEGFDRTIDSYIKNIRQKIEDNHKEPKYIITVYGIGYKFLD